jgi:sugar lactone lactonase YvrE
MLATCGGGSNGITGGPVYDWVTTEIATGVPDIGHFGFVVDSSGNYYYTQYDGGNPILKNGSTLTSAIDTPSHMAIGGSSLYVYSDGATKKIYRVDVDTGAATEIAAGVPGIGYSGFAADSSGNYYYAHDVTGGPIFRNGSTLTSAIDSPYCMAIGGSSLYVYSNGATKKIYKLSWQQIN